MKFSSKGLAQIKRIFQDSLESGELLGKSIENSYMTDLLQAAILAGIPVTSVPTYENWIEVDTVKDLELPITLERI